MMGAKSITNRQTKIFVLLALIIIFSLLVRFSPIVGYSPEPTTYAGGATYGNNYALKTGHYPSPGEAKSIIYSPILNGSNIFAGSLLDSAEHPIFPIFYVSILSVTGLEQESWQFRIAISLIFALPILFIVYSILNSISKKRNHERLNNNLPIVYLGIGLLYSQLASTALITQQGAPGWIFFLYPIYFLFFRKEKDIKIIIISLLFLALLPAAYSTGASFALLWFSIILLIPRFERKNEAVIWRIFLLFAMFYISYSIFISLARTQSLVNIWVNLIETIRNGFAGFEPTGLVLPNEYLSTGTSTLNKINNLVAAIFVAIPVIFFLIYATRRGSGYFKGKTTVLAGIIALPILTLLLFVWLGGLSIGRIPEYGSIISMICIACLFPMMKERKKKFIAVIAVLAILSSSYVFLTDENIPNRLITTSEEGAAKWLMSTSESGKIIFTDHRLTAVFVASGFINITGIYEKETANSTIYELDAIYYSDNASQSIRVLSQLQCNYLFFSEQMTNEIPSIFGYNYQFKPAPLNFLEKYKSNVDFNIICDNGETTVFTFK